MKLIQKIIKFFTKKKVITPKKINKNNIQCLYGPPPSYYDNFEKLKKLDEENNIDDVDK